MELPAEVSTPGGCESFAIFDYRSLVEMCCLAMSAVVENEMLRRYLSMVEEEEGRRHPTRGYSSSMVLGEEGESETTRLRCYSDAGGDLLDGVGTWKKLRRWWKVFL